jgi:hypothetical protein
VAAAGASCQKQPPQRKTGEMAPILFSGARETFRGGHAPSHVAAGALAGSFSPWHAPGGFILNPAVEIEGSVLRARAFLFKIPALPSPMRLAFSSRDK